MASAGNRVILFRSLSLALCKLGELAVELPEAFLGFGEELDLLGVPPTGLPDPGAATTPPPAAAAPTAAFKVLSNICKSFKASGPSLEGSVPNEANGEKSEDIALDEGRFEDEAALEDEDDEVGEAFVGMPNNPGCNIANKLCCWAGVIANGFMDAKAAKD